MKIAIEMKIKKPPPREGSRNTEGGIKSLNMTENCKKKKKKSLSYLMPRGGGRRSCNYPVR